ncbi:hypothetical protein [Allohahella marinimesophila]|uniref:Uncharacterized protein n=1 Tax=Allohahella marinimesophila TaxID=1054972 RepID=A0ABP7PPE9_9GAMM
MATKTVKQDFIKSGDQQTKLEKGKNFNSEFTAREQPSTQAPGRGGYSKPELQSWTDEELKAHVKSLNIQLANNDDREALIDAIVSNSRRS